MEVLALRADAWGFCIAAGDLPFVCGSIPVDCTLSVLRPKTNLATFGFSIRAKAPIRSACVPGPSGFVDTQM